MAGMFGLSNSRISTHFQDRSDAFEKRRLWMVKQLRSVLHIDVIHSVLEFMIDSLRGKLRIEVGGGLGRN